MNQYSHGHHESVLRSHRWRTAENSCAYLLPHLDREMALLDVGCGPGTITADLAARVASVVGIDPSQEVIAEARAAYPDIRFEVAGLLDHEGTYDVVHAHQVLHHLDDPVGALRKMGRLGGLVAAREADYTWFRWTPESPVLDRWLAIYLEISRGNGACPDAGRHLLRWAHEAGFAEVTYTTSTWTFATPEDRSWWCGTWADRCVESSFAQQAVDRRIATTAELRDLAAGWRTWGDDPDAAFVVPHGEIIARA